MSQVRKGVPLQGQNGRNLSAIASIPLDAGFDFYSVVEIDFQVTKEPNLLILPALGPDGIAYLPRKAVLIQHMPSPFVRLAKLTV
jgi:hypothetical protein